MLAPFDHLPDNADCWLYAADRELTTQEVGFLENLFSSFAQEWSSHGRRVQGACAVIDRRVMVVAAHIENGDISGCGIDKSLHLLQEAAMSRSFSWASALNIVFEDAEGHLQIVPRLQFKQLAQEGHVLAGTRVVDLSIRDLGALREHGLLRPAASSWHARLLPVVEEEQVS